MNLLDRKKLDSHLKRGHALRRDMVRRDIHGGRADEGFGASVNYKHFGWSEGLAQGPTLERDLHIGGQALTTTTSCGTCDHPSYYITSTYSVHGLISHDVRFPVGHLGFM